MATIFIQIGIVIILASLLGCIAKFFRQPLIPAYMIAGLLIGPVFQFITDTNAIFLLSEIGIAFLLFIVGLEIDFRRLRSVAFVSTVGGCMKIVILCALGFGIGLWFGFTPLVATYVGLILSFSSTMVVLKLLSDRRELDTLHGRIIIGTLLLEDIVAIFALTVLTTVSSFTGTVLGIALLKGVCLLLGAFVLSRYVFPRLFKSAAANQEVLFLLSLTVMFIFSIVFYYFGFSIAIGAFIAGVALANLKYNIEIMARVKPLRDFFATIFFVALGMEIALDSFTGILPLLAILIFVAIVIKPFLMMCITSLFGYKTRPAFLSSVSLGQISEFGLIVVTQGLVLGHIDEQLFSVTIVVAIASIAATSYVVQYERPLYTMFRKQLAWFETLNLNNHQLGYIPKKRMNYDVILCGHNRIGYSIVEQIKRTTKSILVIDYNPEVITMLTSQKIPCLYGDVSDPEIMERVNFSKTQLLISTVPGVHVNAMLIHRAKKANKRVTVFVNASEVKGALKLYDEGADYVIMPHFLGGAHVSMMIKGAKFSMRKILKNKLFHVQELQHRKSLGHEHPLPNR